MRDPDDLSAVTLTAGWRLPYLALLIVAVLYAATPMAQALDTWTALACGRHIAAHGVDDADPFAFTSRPSSGWSWLPTGWINQNWLTHLLLYLLVQAFGTGALAVFRVVLYGGVAVGLFAAQRLAGVREATAAAVAALALLLARPTFEVRPQDITNLFVALELVVLAAWTHRSRRVLWLVVPLLGLWSGFHGGFVFGFILLLVVASARLADERLRVRTAASGAIRPVEVAAVTLAALAACVLASPYHLANLTHPLVVSVSKDAALWRAVEEWRPFFAGGFDPRNQWYFLTWVAVLAAAAILARHPRHGSTTTSRQAARRTDPGGHSPDLAGVAVAAVAVAMTLQSRRFIPVAVIATTPALGAWVDTAIVAWLAKQQGRDWRPWRRRVAIVAAGAAVALAAHWTWRFVTVYLAAWPHSAGATPVFERMTWAHRRPSAACAFLAANRLEGRLLNAWVDGGYLEWCQMPRPSGHPPVQTFIDGRAQGAFAIGAYRRYAELWGGGPPGLGTEAARAAWVDATLRLDGVRLALIPEDEAQSGVARALAARPNWQVAFLSPTHVLYADTDDPRGRTLIDGVLDGSTVFPDEATRRLTRAFRFLARGDVASASEGLREAEAAYAAVPSALAMQTARRALAHPELTAPFGDFARRVLDEHLARGEHDRDEDGYLVRNGAAIVAASSLADQAEQSGQSGEARRLRQIVDGLRAARERAWRRALW